jgi:hypothetical protein
MCSGDREEGQPRESGIFARAAKKTEWDFLQTHSKLLEQKRRGKHCFAPIRDKMDFHLSPLHANQANAILTFCHAKAECIQLRSDLVSYCQAGMSKARVLRIRATRPTSASLIII